MRLALTIFSHALRAVNAWLNTALFSIVGLVLHALRAMRWRQR